MDYQKQLMTLSEEFIGLIDFSNKNYQMAIGLILFNPIYWNFMARLEHKTHLLTKLSFGSAKLGCYLLAISIFTLGLVRDKIYEVALSEQPSLDLLEELPFKAAGIVSFAIGSVFVLTSMYQLGITGTYLGDYFGILMDHRVTSFPFNVNENPMYNGSTLCFLGTALYYAKPAGVLASLIVYINYRFALLFEEPYTAKIYADKLAKLKSE